MNEIIAATIIASAIGALAVIIKKGLKQVSQSFDNLNASVADLRTKADAVIAILKNPPVVTGTSDAQLDTVTTAIQGIASDLAAATPPPVVAAS